jgi:hypothetical protein
MKFHRRRHIPALVLAACAALFACAALAGFAGADPATEHQRPTSDKIGDTPADFAQPVAPAPKSGDTPADFAQPVAPAPRSGDTPVDHPGASRAPEYDPPATIQVLRPERTIVRDANQALPTILAGLALLVAVGGTGYAFVQTRPLRRGVVGGLH